MIIIRCKYKKTLQLESEEKLQKHFEDTEMFISIYNS